MSGWIKLYRQINSNPVLKKSRVYSNFEAFIWLLLKANYNDAKVVIGSTIYKLKQGQMITSQKKLCKQFGWGNSRLKTFLKLLKNDGMINVSSNKQLTKITLLNWDSYQDSNLQTIHKKLTTNSQPTTNKKNKEETKKNKEQSFINQVSKVGKNKYKQDLIDEFCNYWTERNMSGRKMKFEMQKTFDINRRLATWHKNSFEWSFENKEEKIVKQKDDFADKQYQDQLKKQREIDANAPDDNDFKDIKNILKGTFNK